MRVSLIKDLHFPKVESMTRLKRSSNNLARLLITKLSITITLVAHKSRKIKVKEKINKKFNSKKGDSKNCARGMF